MEPPPTTPHNCDEGYIPYWIGCYKVYETGSWVEGEQTCAMEGGHLVSIHVEPENVFALSIARAASVGAVWIGWRKGGDDVYRYNL